LSLQVTRVAWLTGPDILTCVLLFIYFLLCIQCSHCTSDADCGIVNGVQLECLRRCDLEPIPGCSGLGDPGMRYCWDASAHPEPSAEEGGLTQIGSNWNPTVTLNACEGDCDNVSFVFPFQPTCHLCHFPSPHSHEFLFLDHEYFRTPIVHQVLAASNAMVWRESLHVTQTLWGGKWILVSEQK